MSADDVRAEVDVMIKEAEELNALLIRASSKADDLAAHMQLSGMTMPTTSIFELANFISNITDTIPQMTTGVLLVLGTLRQYRNQV
jgi:hypothetical protein